MEIALSTIITMYMIMLGPVKLILPFAHATANANVALKREIALRTTLWGGGVALICLMVGDFVVEKFLLSAGTLMIAISFFLATFAYSLARVGDPAQTKGAPPPPETPTKELAAFPLAFPGVIPPQGFGLLVLTTQVDCADVSLSGLTLDIVLVAMVMVANFVCMIGAEAILKITGRMFWLLLCRFLSPLFVALSVHIFLTGLQLTGILQN